MEGGECSTSQGKREDRVQSDSNWYFSRREIEENSPSRKDGIDLKQEAYLRKSYSIFLRVLGRRLKVPLITLATATILCHRFFLRQSHAKNDWMTIATACMFISSKVRETPFALSNLILFSYELIHKNDPAAAQRIKQREVFIEQIKLLYQAEILVLITLDFDLHVEHPYRVLAEGIERLDIDHNAFPLIACGFVNDGLQTTISLQFKPHQIAAAAVFLAAQSLKVEFPSDGEMVWWQEFGVTPEEVREVSSQITGLPQPEAGRPTPSRGGEAEGTSAGETSSSQPTTGGASVVCEQAQVNIQIAPRTDVETPKDRCDDSGNKLGDPKTEDEIVRQQGGETKSLPWSREDVAGTSGHSLNICPEVVEVEQSDAKAEVPEAGEGMKEDLPSKPDGLAGSSSALHGEDDPSNMNTMQLMSPQEKHKRSLGGETSQPLGLMDNEDVMEGVEMTAEDQKGVEP